MAFIDMLNRRCSFEKPRRVEDGMGGWDEVWTVVKTGVRCSLNPISANQDIYYQRLGLLVTHVVWMQPQSAEIDETYRIVMEDGSLFKPSFDETGVILGIKDIGGRFRIWELAVTELK